MPLTKDDILAVMQNELFLDVSGLDDETPLFSSGLIDSFSLATLIMAIENKAGFRIAPLDVTLENLDTIGRMIRFVAAKTA